MKAIELIGLIEEWAPRHLVEEWDNTGFQVGDPDRRIGKILLALDLDRRVLDRALEIGADMIITHHPLIFSPLKSLNKLGYKEGLIYDIIKGDLVVYNAHTNLDMAKGGVNDALAQVLGVKKTRLLRTVYQEEVYKLAVFVPPSHRERLLDALAQAGAGVIGNYSHCSYNIEGFGTFRPMDGADPYSGEIGNLERVEETRIETMVNKKDLAPVINAMIKAHPYDEVAYDIYKLGNRGEEFGYGRVGEIEEMELGSYLEIIKERLELDKLTVYGDMDRTVRTVALCGGSGAGFIGDAASKKADIYISGDIKYHDAQYGDELGLTIVDAGHYHTEKVILPVIKDYLKDRINEDIGIEIYQKSSPPYTVV